MLAGAVFVPFAIALHNVQKLFDGLVALALGFERERKIVEAREAEEKSRADAIAARLAAIEIAIARRVGDTEQLYGSVTAADIADFLKTKGFDIDRRKLILPDAIKALGVHDVPLKP